MRISTTNYDTMEMGRNNISKYDYQSNRIWNGEFFDYKTDFLFNFIIKQENFVAVILGISPLLNHTGMVFFV